MNLTEQLIRDEGLRHEPYKCTAGKWTVGVGWNISDNGIPAYAADELMEGHLSNATIYRLLQRGIEQASKDAKDFCGWRTDPESLNEARWNALVNMAFNLGSTRLHKFVRMRAALQACDWERVADEALDSKWAGQVGERARRIAYTFRTGLAA